MNVYERIVELLKDETILQDFKYVKSLYSFVKREEGVKYTLDLRHDFLFTVSMSIMPSADVTFDVLEKWWARFDFRSPADRRYIFTFGVDPRWQGPIDPVYDFAYDGSNFDEEYPKFREAALGCIEYMMTRFDTVEDYYREVVLPVLEGRRKAPYSGSKWVFEYLSACRMLHPESYEQLKKIVMEKVEYNTLTGEPNIIKYKDRWDEILEYLESLDFSSGKARLPRKKPGKTPTPESKTRK